MSRGAPKNFVGIMGATQSGKTTVTQKMIEMFYLNNAGMSCATFLNFADSLKECALKNGWSGLKDAEGRAWIQDFSERWKHKYGEMVFYDQTMRKALAQDQYDWFTCFFGDTRFSHEIRGLLDLQRNGNNVKLVYIKNDAAEARWREAYDSWFETGEDQYKWAVHRSELEWRHYLVYGSCKSVIVFENNDYSAGLEAAAERLNFQINAVSTQTIRSNT